MSAPDWLGPDAEIDLSTSEGQQRAERIIRSASWIVRMHIHFNGTADVTRKGVAPPLLPWREMVGALKGEPPAELDALRSLWSDS